MRITYWPDVDILDIKLREVKVSENDELCEGIMPDYDEEGTIVGLKILSASKLVTDPQNLVLESMGHPVKPSKPRS